MALEDDIAQMTRRLEDLVRTLTDLRRDLGTSAVQDQRHQDQMVQAVARLTAVMTQNNRTRAQETRFVERFMRDVRSSSDAVQAATEATTAQTQATTAQTQATTAQTQAQQTQIRTQAQAQESLQRLRAAQDQNRNFAVILAREQMAEAAANRSGIKILQDRLGADVAAQKALMRGVAALQQLASLGQGLTRFGQNLAQGNTSFSALTPVIDSLAGVVGRLVGSIPLVGGVLQGVAQGAAEGFKFLLSQLETATQTFQQISAVGALTEGGMSQLQRQFLESGLSLEGYRRVITSNAQALARFGGTVGEGARLLTELTGSIIDSDAGDALRRLGLSADAIGESNAAYITQQTRLGLGQRKSQQQLIQGSIEYAQELDRLAKLTGIQRQELQAQQDAALSEARFRAAYDEMVERGRETQAKAMMAFQTIFSKLSPETSQGLRDMASGFTNSNAAIKLFNTTGGAAADIMERVKTGQLDQVTATKLLQNAIQQNINLFRSLALAQGDELDRNISYAQQSDIANAKLINGQLQLERQQQEQMKKGTDPLTDSTVNAQKNLEQMSRQLQNFALSLLPAAGQAVSGFTDILNRGIQAIAQATGIELKSITGAGAGATSAGATSAGATSSAVFSGPGARVFSGGLAGRLEDLLSGGHGFRAYSGAGPAAPLPQPPESRAPAPLGPRPAPRPGTEQNADTLRKLGLIIKEGDVQQSGQAVSPKILALAQSIQKEIPGFRYFSSFNDRFHNENAPGSFHTQGQALDFTLTQRPTEEQGRKILQMLNKMGADYARDEYNFPSSRSTAGHFHAHVREFARGGIARGPNTGYAATLHGTEAVVPLPDGRTIPVKIETDMDSVIERMAQRWQQTLMDVMSRNNNNSAMESALQQLIDLQRNSNNTQQRLLQAAVN